MAIRARLWSGHVDAQLWDLLLLQAHLLLELCRFDELVAGVALALLKNRHVAAWARMTAHSATGLLAAGRAITALTFWLFLDDHYGLRRPCSAIRCWRWASAC
jgi:hypothetical protein